MTKTKSNSKIFLMIAILFAFILTSCWVNVRLDGKVYAEGSTSEIVSVTNGNFDASTSTYIQTSPSGWTSIGTAQGSVTNGVISVLPTDFEERYSSYSLTKLQNPGKNSESDDNRVLMLNSSVSSNKGYQNSSAITLSANSYYKFSVLVKTLDGYGSIYLTGLDNDFSDAQSFTNIDSTDAYYWTEYTFFVKTGFKAESVKLQLRMGEHNKLTDGIIFFDNVVCEQLAESAFYETYSPEVETSLLVDLFGSREISSFIPTSTFDASGNLTSWTPYAGNTTENEYTTVNVFNSNEFTSRNIEILGSDNSYDNSHALLLHNTESGVVGVESAEFNIPFGSLFIMTFNVKLGTLENASGLTIKLIEGELVKDEITDYAPQTFTMSALTSLTATSLKNGYTTCYFLIKGNCLFDTTAKIQITLGSTDKGEVGSAVVDTFKLFNATTSEISGLSTSSTCVSADFNSSAKTQTITNGNFNSYEIENYNTPIFPAKPSSWTHNAEEIQTTEQNWQYGVINLEENNFNTYKENYGLTSSIGNPSSHNEGESNNVVMLRNKTVTYQTLVSPNFTVSANTYQTLSFEIRTLTPSEKLNIYVVDQTNGITIFEANGISSENNWTKYILQIKSANVSETFVIKFEFGTISEPISGHAFIDNVRIDTSSLTATTFEELQETTSFNKVIKKIDLSYGMYTLTGTDTDGILSLNAWNTSSSTLTTDGIAGILSKDLANEVNSEIKNILYLENYNTTSYTLTYKLPYTFASGSYYKVSMKVKTAIATPTTKYDADGKEIANNYGLAISLSGFNDTFENIKENDGFETYTFYLAPSSEVSSTLSFNLTSTGTDCLGKAYIGDILIETSDETTYTLTKSQQTENADSRIVLSGETKEDDDETDDTTNNNSSFNWLLIPSLVLSVAVVLALVTFVISKFRIKKYEVEVINEYNRETTLEKDIVRKEAKSIQDNEIKVCKEKLNLVKEELDACENEYNDTIKNKTTLDAKEKEKIFKTYASKRTKIQDKYNYVVEELQSISSEEHFNKLEKKVVLKDKSKKTSK